MITGGEAVAFLVDYAFALVKRGAHVCWGIIPAILLFVGMLFLPETPRWMVLKGFISQAKETLKIRNPLRQI